MPRSFPKRRFCLALVAILGTAITGDIAHAQTSNASPNAALPGIQVDTGWVRPTHQHGATAPAFFTIRNTGITADTLISATCPIAHRTVMLGGAGNPIGGIPIKAGQTLHLKAPGPHIVLEDMRFRLYPRALIPCSVSFLSAGSRMLYLKVRPAKATKGVG